MSNLQGLKKRTSLQEFSPSRAMKPLTLGAAGLAVAVVLCVQGNTSAQQPASAQGYGALRQTQGVPSPSRDAAGRVALDKYCVSCHNERVKTAGLMLDRADVAEPWRQHGGLGKGGAQSAHRHDAAAQHAAACRPRIGRRW